MKNFLGRSNFSRGGKKYINEAMLTSCSDSAQAPPTPPVPLDDCAAKTLCPAAQRPEPDGEGVVAGARSEQVKNGKERAVGVMMMSHELILITI